MGYGCVRSDGLVAVAGLAIVLAYLLVGVQMNDR